MSPDKIPEPLAQLIELAASYAEVARATGATPPIASLVDELVYARRRLTIAAAPPAWSLEQAMRNAAVRLWLAGEAHGPDRWRDEVAICLPHAQRHVAALSQPQAAALAAVECAASDDLRSRAAHVIALLVAGLDRPATVAIALDTGGQVTLTRVNVGGEVKWSDPDGCEWGTDDDHVYDDRPGAWLRLDGDMIRGVQVSNPSKAVAP
ncbi:MAG: hypothetical protein MUF34_20130 [Polyangiaceae bacterium]|jgi:hypothetical protein|nr:hypothetical protein [Polyangiaceae bacterium]